MPVLSLVCRSSRGGHSCYVGLKRSQSFFVQITQVEGSSCKGFNVSLHRVLFLKELFFRKTLCISKFSCHLRCHFLFASATGCDVFCQLSF